MVTKDSSKIDIELIKECQTRCKINRCDECWTSTVECLLLLLYIAIEHRSTNNDNN